MKVIISLVLLFLGVNTASAQVEKIRTLQKNLISVKDSTQYIDDLNRIALLLYEQNVDSTLYYALHAREMAYRQRYPKGLADATNNLGVVYDIKGNTQLALRYYNDAYNQYMALSDSSNIVQTLMNIAGVYSVSGRDQKALPNFERALILGNQIQHDSITAIVIYNYVLSYPGKFTNQKKASLIQRADEISERYKDMRLKMAIQQLKAKMLIENKQRERGIKLLEKTLSETLTMQLYFLSMDILMDLGENYMQSDPEKGIAYFQQTVQLAEQKNYGTYAREVYKKLYEIYLTRGDRQTAFIYSQKLLNLYEKLSDIDRVSGIDYIQYAVKDQELISEHLKSEYNAQMLWLAIAVCILTLLSLIFLWRNWKLGRKTNSLLTLQFKQLEATSKALEISNQNYTKLIKTVAHDLRNPIGAVSSLTTLLMDDNLTPEEHSQFVTLIQESSNSCLHLIDDLLQTDFGFKESELHKENIELTGFLQQAVTLLTFRANEKNQRLIFENSGPLMLHADRDKLLRVFNNLIVNAIKFSAEGQSVFIKAKQSHDGITITVQDHGLGIPKDYAEKLFDPFTSSKRQGTAGEQPFGLGLYISKQIIEAHRGKIWFESEEGKGTTFFIFLPGATSM